MCLCFVFRWSMELRNIDGRLAGGLTAEARFDFRSAFSLQCMVVGPSKNVECSSTHIEREHSMQLYASFVQLIVRFGLKDVLCVSYLRMIEIFGCGAMSWPSHVDI